MADVTADVELKPADLELKEVRGPSALGGGWRRFFDLLFLISVTEFRRSYFGTVLGYFWSLVRPLLMFAVLLFVFTQIFGAAKITRHYPEILLFDIVLFSFFSEATSNAVLSVVGNEAIVRKMQFPRLVAPMSVVLTALFNFAVNMVAVLAFALAFGVRPMWTWLLFPVIVGAVVVLAACVSMLLSSLFVRFRDVSIIWSVVVMALMYGTPVIYVLESPPGGIVPPQFIHPLLVNPLAPIFVQARHWLIDPAAPTALQTAGDWLHLLPAAVIYVGVCVLAVWVFNREAPRVAESL